jgi:23S rRNA pseudouridine1911/1915/1917 synthase
MQAIIACLVFLAGVGYLHLCYLQSFYLVTRPVNQPITAEILEVSPAGEQMRVDAYLALRFPEISRSRLQAAIRRQQVKIDGLIAKPSTRLAVGQRLEVVLPEPEPACSRPEDIPLDILFEDEWLVAINKPPGMVVHPAKGHWSGTLTAALVHHFSQLSQAGGTNRPGIVHRLDRDTSGVILIAKHDLAHVRLTEQFEARTVKKQYLAIVTPAPDRDRDLIDKPIGVHPYQREKMAIREHHPTSKPAITQYEVACRFRGLALVKAYPKTGRTHQIRLHLAHAGYPILADKLYGGRSRFLLGELTGRADDTTELLNRQALHAEQIEFAHPHTGETVIIAAPIPADLQLTIDMLARYRALK